MILSLCLRAYSRTLDTTYTFTAMQRSGRSIWAVFAFLLGFATLIVVVSHYYLIPAMLAAKDATAAQKRQLSAQATLLLAVVLVILLVGLMVVLQMKRFFSSHGQRNPPTRYVDAWSESAKRLRSPPPDESA